MNANDYQIAALRTAKLDQERSAKLRYSALAAIGEAGEYAELAKKATWHGHHFSPDDAIKELGDCAWYLAFSAMVWGYTLSEVIDRCDTEPRRDEQMSLAAQFVDGALFLGGAAADYANLASLAAENALPADRDDALAYLVTWADAIISNAQMWGYALADVFERNIAKLRARYPEGFTTAASVARVDVA